MSLVENQNIESDWLKRWNFIAPNKEAIYDYNYQTSYTYSQLWSAANGLALHLQTQGVKTGDRVAVLAKNKVETVILFFALQRLGAILVPVNFRLTAPEVDYILNDCKPKILFYELDFKSIVDNLTQTASKVCFEHEDGLINLVKKSLTHIEQISFKSNHESPCMILYTSGTTGFPKGAILTHKMLFWNSINTTISLNVVAEDVTISFAPLFHTGGWNVLLTPFIHRGGRIVFFEKFDALPILKACEEEKVTLLFGVPTTLAMMSAQEEFKNTDLSSIRYMIVGGEPMPLNLIQTWHQKGVPIRQGFGLTEFGPNCFSLNESDAENKMGSIGRPNFYVNVRVVDDNNDDVQPGEVGELLLNGPSRMQGYWNNPTATANAIKDGWLHTGDLVRYDEDYYFYVVGRKKEMFISGGENVYPIEVERVLQSHPQILEAAVIGVKDNKWGEVGRAFVVAKTPPPSTETLQQFCRQNLAGYKVPKYFTFINELPKGDSGKIQKRSLHDISL